MNRPEPPLPDLAAIGPFFALAVGAPDEPGWRRASSLSASRSVGDWVGWGVGRLGWPDRVVAASLLYQGWAARMTSIFAGSTVLCGAAPDLSAGGLWYRYPPAGGAMELSVEAQSPLPLLPPDEAWRRVVDANLSPLASAVRASVRIGRRLLWGNVASALAGSLAALARGGHGPLEELIAAPWASPPELAGLGDWTATGPALRFRRTTCCLYERLPGAARCGDCSLDG